MIGWGQDTRSDIAKFTGTLQQRIVTLEPIDACQINYLRTGANISSEKQLCGAGDKGRS